MGAVPGEEAWWNRALVSTGYRISVCSGEKGLEIAGGDSCVTPWVYLIPLKYTFYNGYHGKL